MPEDHGTAAAGRSALRRRSAAGAAGVAVFASGTLLGFVGFPGRVLLAALMAALTVFVARRLLADRSDGGASGATPKGLAGVGSTPERREALLRTLDLHANVSVTDRSGRILEVNDNFCRVSGYSREELLGQPHSIVNSGTHSTEFWGELWSTLAAGRAWRGEICNRAKDGSLYWVDSTIAPIPGTLPEAPEYLSIRTDITAAKLTEQRLRASEAFLRSSEAFLDRTGRTAGIGGWQYDLATGLIDWSAHLNRIHETPVDYRPTLEEALSFYPAEVRPAVERAIAEASLSGAGWDLELPLVTATGREIWVRVVGQAEFVDGRPARLVGSTQDITARKETEKSLRYERDLMASLLETLPDQIYFKDVEGKFLRVNAGMARRHKLNHPAEAVGKSDADFFPAEHARRTAEMERQIMESAEPVLELEEQLLWDDRPPTWSLTSKMPLYDAEDRIVGTFGISRDITARKGVEAQLQEASARLTIAADAAGIGVWEFTVGSTRLLWDERMHRIYEIPAGGATYASWSARVHPEDRARCEEEIAAALRGEKEFDTEFRIVRPQGEVRYLKASARTERGPDGVAVRMIGVNIDVTERRRAELKLLETSSLLRTVLDSASETSVIATDPGLIIKVFNEGAMRLLGYRSEEVIDRGTLTSLHDPEELARRAKDLSTQLGRPFDPGAALIEPSTLDQARDCTYRRKDGSAVRVSLVVSAMYTPTGELVGYIGVAHDITRQKQYEESLRDATQKAENANRAKSQFLANMSHEIRTPMNAVIGLSYLLAETELETTQRELLSKIQISSKSLLAIINDVLDLTKIEAAELIVESSVFSPFSLLRGVCDVIAMQAHAKAIEFEVDLAPDLPIALKGDATRLSQILTNLLANAVKFTDRGSVSFIVSRIANTSSDTTLSFVVRDTGIGISPEAQAHLFAPFSQADASITRRYGGTGLGLSIVKSLTKLLGGDVSLKSEPGQGSEFTVVLKFAEAAPEQLVVQHTYAEAPGGRVLAGVRVLLVDDSDINLDVTKRILELHGAQVWLANNGFEACERLREQPYDFHVVLMDVQMPLLDGYQATSRIRSELGLVDLPIIALTAGALSSERQRAVAAGMDDFIIKPFDASTLTTTILRHVRISILQAATPTYALSQPPAPATIAWPVIAGIDSTDARVRVYDDFGLFRSSLKRLLEEFSDVALPAGSERAEELLEYASRMHKLAGCAGMLGANSIQQLSVDTRAACLSGEIKLAERLAGALGEQLNRMRRSAAPIFESARKDAAEADRAPRAADSAMPPQQLAELIESLREQSLSALYRFDAIAPHLKPLLGSASFEVVREHMENLRFMEAAKALEANGVAGSGSLDEAVPTLENDAAHGSC